MFCFLAALASFVPTAILSTYWYKHRSEDMSYMSVDSRGMYVKLIETLITASGIAAAIVAVELKNNFSGVTFYAKWAVSLLVTCIIFSVFTIWALLRNYEVAEAEKFNKIRDLRASDKDDEASKLENSPQVRLSSGKMLFILILANVTFTAFLLGFLFIGRIVFQM